MAHTFAHCIDNGAFRSGQQSFVRKVLRSYDTSNAGFLSKDTLHTAMDRLALGLNNAEKRKVSIVFICPNFFLITCRE
jgi:hypothetical protein